MKSPRSIPHSSFLKSVSHLSWISSESENHSVTPILLITLLIVKRSQIAYKILHRWKTEANEFITIGNNDLKKYRKVSNIEWRVENRVGKLIKRLDYKNKKQRHTISILWILFPFSVVKYKKMQCFIPRPMKQLCNTCYILQYHSFYSCYYLICNLCILY